MGELKLFDRDILSGILPWMERREAILLTGSRQVGKTCIMHLLKRELRSQGISDNHIEFIDLEDLQYKMLFDQGVRSVLKLLKERGKLSPAHRTYLFLDEIHYLGSPSNLIKLLVDHHPELKVICSGSSSSMIRRKFRDSMVGRKVEFHVSPLNFREYLTFRNLREKAQLLKPLTWERLINSDFQIVPLSDITRQELVELYEDYLIYGGYPAVVLTDESQLKKKILSEIFNDYVRKDIQALFNLDDLNQFTRLVSFLATMTGNLTNISAISAAVQISRPTVMRYLEILQHTFIVAQLPPYFGNIRKRLVKMPKTYFYDTGLRNRIINQFAPLPSREDRGILAENGVFCSLLKTLSEEKGISFWRTQKQSEIDFIVDEIPVEIKYQSLKTPVVPRAMYPCLDALSSKTGIVVTRDFLGEKTFNHKWIRFVPAFYL